jgi:hypothetical protein
MTPKRCARDDDAMRSERRAVTRARARQTNADDGTDAGEFRARDGVVAGAVRARVDARAWKNAAAA